MINVRTEGLDISDVYIDCDFKYKGNFSTINLSIEGHTKNNVPTARTVRAAFTSVFTSCCEKFLIMFAQQPSAMIFVKICI
jgi:hypothetical protein